MKVFDFNGNLGQMVDQITGQPLTNTNTVFRKTDKGLNAFFSKSRNSRLDFGSTKYIDKDTPFTIEFWSENKGFASGADYPIIASLLVENQTDSLYIGYSNAFPYSEVFLLNGAGNGFRYAGDLPVGLNHFIIKYNGSGDLSVVSNYSFVLNNAVKTISVVPQGFLNPSTLNGIGGANNISDSNNTDLYGCVQKVSIYNHETTTLEDSRLFQDYQETWALYETKRGLTYPKPTNLNENGLAAAYNMTPENGEIVDISTNTNDGAIDGATQTEEGLKFNGTSNKITVPANVSLNLGNDVSISARVKLSVLGLTPITSKGAASLLFTLVSGGKLRLYWGVGGDYYTSNIQVVNVNQWCTLTATYENGVVAKLYVNGVEVAGALTGIYSTPVMNANSLFIGRWSSFYMNGEIADTRLYGKVLSLEEVQKYHSSFKKPLYINNFKFQKADGLTTEIEDMETVSGSFVVKTDSEKDNYLYCSSGGDISLNYSDTILGQAVISFNGVEYSDTLTNLISAHSWLSYANNKLTFSMTAAQTLEKIINQLS